jgi:hypothetical protein
MKKIRFSDFQNTPLWDVASYVLLEGYKPFVVKSCLRLQEREYMTARFSGTSVLICQATRHHV